MINYFINFIYKFLLYTLYRSCIRILLPVQYLVYVTGNTDFQYWQSTGSNTRTWLYSKYIIYINIHIATLNHIMQNNVLSSVNYLRSNSSDVVWRIHQHLFPWQMVTLSENKLWCVHDSCTGRCLLWCVLLWFDLTRSPIWLHNRFYICLLMQINVCLLRIKGNHWKWIKIDFINH